MLELITVISEVTVAETRSFLQRVGIAESYSSAVYAMIGSVRLSVRLSVRPSVLRHIPVFCRDE